MQQFVDKAWSPKAPAEVEDLGFDFAALAPSVSAITVQVELVSGADSAPISLSVDAPVVDAALATVRVRGGAAGADYRLTCRAVAPDGRVLVLVGTLPVRP